MRLKLILLLCLGFTFPNLVFANGKIRVNSETKGAYIYIDDKKRAMIGDGFTTISVSEGDHIVTIRKQISQNLIAEGSKKVFVGDKTEIELFIPTTMKSRIKVDISTPEKLAKLLLKSLISNEKEWFLSQVLLPKEEVINHLKKIGFKQRAIKEYEADYAYVTKGTWDVLFALSPNFKNGILKVVRIKEQKPGMGFIEAHIVTPETKNRVVLQYITVNNNSHLLSLIAKN